MKDPRAPQGNGDGSVMRPRRIWQRKHKTHHERTTQRGSIQTTKRNQATRKTIMLNYMDLAGGQEAHKRDETNQLADHEKEKKYKKKKKQERRRR